MVGWAIQQGKNITSQEGKQEVVELKDSIRGMFQGRSCHNWGLLLFFVKKVCLHIFTMTSTIWSPNAQALPLEVNYFGAKIHNPAYTCLYHSCLHHS